MRQQIDSAQSLSHADEFSSSFVRPSGPVGGLGNSAAQDRFNLLLDINAYLDMQLSIVKNLPHEAQTDRVNGIMEVLQQVSDSYQGGQEINIGHLPQAPKASEKPTMNGLMPELRSSLLEFNLSLSVFQQRNTLVAGLMGGSTDSNVPLDTGLLVASANDTGVDTGLLTLATRINELRLKLPGESGRFSLTQYGDFSSIRIILNECIAMGIRSPDQVAYVLATAWHESRMGTWMTESGWMSERRAERIGEREYGPNGHRASEARRYGNTNAGDGGRYMGRGYVQLTWKNNYERMSNLLKESGYQYTHNGVTYGNGQNGTQEIDLVTNYRHVNENKELAARILVFGMDGGHYVQDNRGLDHYLPEGQDASHQNFQNARRIVNGTDKRRLIADNAVTIANVLRNGDAWVNLFGR